eukprot:9481688-Ditylum_brightwellii.AAC.1
MSSLTTGKFNSSTFPFYQEAVSMLTIISHMVFFLYTCQGKMLVIPSSWNQIVLKPARSPIRPVEDVQPLLEIS